MSHMCGLASSKNFRESKKKNHTGAKTQANGLTDTELVRYTVQ